ncbi:MAG TPA: hypothetical protein DHV16_06400 [Nitrospiraceae bacterium]|nr:hypothetical protein [Nitrospiraceae bacterium]HCL81277.1 hypothetical protein [Nitrospiraceae bacterium]HCZ11874.1 hypothetical protein [Nitrospiraceae bacterium]
MGKQFAFFYFMKKEPEKIKDAVPLHIEYWHKLKLSKYLGGPFADRTGGMITFEAESVDDANRIIINDPFVIQDLLESNWIKEWVVEI